MALSVITGGTRGIGAATARRLAAEGHDLVLGFHTDADSAERTRAEIEALGVRVVTVGADLATDEGIEALFAAAASLGQVTGVVNNAGATYEFAPLAATPADSVRRTIEVNLTGAVLVARAAVLAMSTSYGGAGGVIVNVSSGAATLGSPGEYVHYAAAKAGIDALTKGLGLEVAREGIRVVAVAPGLTDTDLHATTGDPGRVERMAPQIPLGRAGSPAEVADVIAWLMSDQASYVTATTIRATGGR
jgi:NAD(P)-dependent dehydrogenase (short-subunit alcohol dehydrogenase family)